MRPSDRYRGGKEGRGSQPGARAARRSGSRGKTTGQGELFSAAVVLAFIFASTAISLYDLRLLIKFLAS